MLSSSGHTCRVRISSMNKESISIVVLILQILIAILVFLSEWYQIRKDDSVRMRKGRATTRPFL